MSAYIYDIECYPNLFMITFISPFNNQGLVDEYCKADWSADTEFLPKSVIKKEILAKIEPKVFIISEQANMLTNLYNFIQTVKLLIGYNNNRYDDLMLDFLFIKLPIFRNANYLTICTELYDLSQTIVQRRDEHQRYSNPIFKGYKHTYSSIDLMKVLYLDAKKISLKQVAINLKWYRIQDLPIKYNQNIMNDEIEEILDYNINDVLITRHLYWEAIEEVRLRVDVGAYYNLNLLNSSRSNTGDKIFNKFYSEQTDLKQYQYNKLRTYRTVIDFNEIINFDIYFKSPSLQQFLSRLKNTKFKVGSIFKEKIIFRDNAYMFATGGLHTADRGQVFESTDKYIIRDCDVNSFYLYIMLNERIAPKHLDKVAYLSIIDMLTNQRIAAKKAGENVKAAGLKITALVLFGKLGFEFGPLFDVKALYQTTINGQLRLLQLAEKFELGEIHVISANTDGLVCRIPKDKEELYYQICNEWCEETKLTLEYTDYIKYIRTTVNDYMALKVGSNKPKVKGDFIINSELDKGYNTPVIAHCVQQYYLYGKPVEDSLREHTNIYDFCLSQKIGGKFTPEFHHIVDNKYQIDILQKNNRYYISTSGGSIQKAEFDEGRLIKRIGMAAGETVTIFNDYVHYEDFSKYNVDYKYYKRRVYELIWKIENMLTKDAKGGKNKSGISGNLFKELEDDYVFNRSSINNNNSIT